MLNADAQNLIIMYFVHSNNAIIIYFAHSNNVSYTDGKTFKKPRCPYEKERLDAELRNFMQCCELNYLLVCVLDHMMRNFMQLTTVV